MGSDLISQNIKNSVAPSTWKNYTSSWLLWSNFLLALNVTVSEYSESIVLLFLQSLIQKKYSWSHICKTLSGISFFLRLYSLPPCHSFFSVRQVLKGYKRKNFKKDSRSPITPDMLSRICMATGYVCSSNYEAALFSSVFTLTFFAAFRISEVLPCSKTSTSGMLSSNVEFLSDGLRIFLRFSKTDPLGLGAWINLKECTDVNICPVKTLRFYFALRPNISEFLFIHENGSPLTVYQFSAVLKRCLVYLRLSHLKITCHSFRIGAATEAARIGLQDNIIKKIGRWSSNSFQLYIRPY